MTTRTRHVLSLVFVAALVALLGGGHVAQGSGYIGGGGGGGNPSMGGDIGGTATAATVNKISGSSPIAITPANLQWAVGTTGPTISQVTAASDVATQSLSITPQAPFASATLTNRTAGSLVVNVAAPTNGGTGEAGLVVQRAGTFVGQLGMVTGNSLAGLFLGNATPSSTNYILASNAGNTTQFNAPGGGSLQFAVGGTATAQMTGSGWQGGNAGVPWKWIASAVTFAASGTTTLSTAQEQTPLITLSTVTLSGASTLAFGNVTGFFLVDVSGVTLSAQTLTFGNGTGTIVVSPLISANKTLITVICTSNHIAAG